MKANLLIEASAGTGKTQALAVRLIELLKLGVKPQEIVALTFSRAAAGEIFERFATLLAQKAETDPEAVKLLREVVSTQHLSQIGTMDSFMMRIVRSFPLELGLSGKLEIIDGFAHEQAVTQLALEILGRTDKDVVGGFSQAFELVTDHENVRQFINKYREFIKSWHKRVLANPDPRSWGDASAIGLDWPMANQQDLEACADGMATPVNAVDGQPVEAEVWENVVDWVRGFRTFNDDFKGLQKKFVELGTSLFAGPLIECKFGKKKYQLINESAKMIRDAVRTVVGYELRKKLESARGIYLLMTAFEAEYDRKVRKTGRLTFEDVPRLIAGLDEQSRLALEYRMDARIRAWALDEFQDTSREQWRAFAGLLDEAKQSAGEKSVFVVGDRKQAIYGWRNGDVRIFNRERESGLYDVGELKKSWRFGPAVTKAVNDVFVHGRIPDEYPQWSSPEHESAKPELTGFVQTVEANGTDEIDFVEPVFNALQAVDPVTRGISAAILVRNNAFGELLADELRRRGVKDVVWVGDSGVLDTPALRAFLDVLYLADHPGNRQAYEHFRRSPLAAAKYGTAIPSAAEISGEFAQAFAARGIVRTFRELRALLPEDPEEAWNGFTESRFTDMLRAAAEFESGLTPKMRLADFVDFLEEKSVRGSASAGKIQIMTIHRSKGLGFDYVILPLHEKNGLEAADSKSPLIGDGWVLPHLNKNATNMVEALRPTLEKQKAESVQEALCVYYVAMTRAKRSMTIVLHKQPDKKSGTQRFSQFVRESIPEPIGDPAWYLTRAEEKQNPDEAEETWPEIARGPRRQVQRRLPSLSFHTGESAGNLFAAGSVRKAAVEHGLEVHAEYERIEWIAPEEARNALERELVKPADFTALWREQAFELRIGEEWVSGRFDRVVFAGGKATVCDYKTNAMRADETAEAFAGRMRTAYAGQMAAYRRAVAALTGLDETAVSAKLLLTANMSVVDV